MPSKLEIAFFLIFAFLLCTNNFSKAAIIENNDITQDTIWTASDVHVVTRDININPGVTLTIEPGTIVKLNSNCRLYVNQSALMAQGIENNPIVFTSYRDDHFGGDTNEDGPGNGQPGDWEAICFYQAVSTQSKIEHCTIRYAGLGNMGAVYLERSDISVLFNDIGYSSSYGIYSSSASLIIQGNRIHNCQLYGVYHLNASQARIIENIITENAYGIYVHNATPEIENNLITHNNEWGIYFYQADNAPIIQNNTITHNYQSVYIPASAVPDSDDGNILLPNTLDAIWIRGNERKKDMHFQRQNVGQDNEINTYCIYDTITMNAESTLTIDPGVIVKFYDNAGLTIHGALVAIGSSQLPVVFTSYADDRFGGDLNQDAYHSSPENGDWRSIFFSNYAMDHVSVIDHAIICYGGNTNQGMVYAYQTDLEIKNSQISNSSTNGIRAYQSSFNLYHNEIFGNSNNGISLESNGEHTIIQSRIFTNLGDGIVSTSYVNLSLTSCEIFANEGYGVRNTSNENISARNNWWGAINGPGGIAGGDGDEVNENIDFSNFLVQGTQFSYFNAGPNLSQGTIPGPNVTQGIASTAWGNDSGKSILYDLDRVILNYQTINPDLRYEVFLTCYNADDTSGIGGNIQRLVYHNDHPIHGSVNIARNTPRQYHVYLPHQSYEQGQLKLQFVRENGYRAVISQVWIIERSSTSDIQPPMSTIAQAIDKEHLSGNAIEITGTSLDNESGIFDVEMGINNGTEIIWYPVTQFQSNGRWSYIWTLPADGPYTLCVRARDMAGNLETVASSISVIVNNQLPQAASYLSAHDVPEDTGGQIILSWKQSSDDGQGANDIRCYELERSTAENGLFSNTGRVNAGGHAYTDNTAIDGQAYYYRIKSIDLAENFTLSNVYGPVISINNTLPDNTPPENITELNAIAGNGFIYVSWINSTNTDLDLVDQLLDISTDEGATWQKLIHMDKETDAWFIENLNNNTSYRIRIRTKDSSGNISEGVTTASITPSATAVTTISGTIDKDTIWFAGVFFVNYNLTINAGVTLTIQPGVIVKFGANRNLTVNGTLIAEGTDERPIVFTSYADDSFEGDSNGDGESMGHKGDWGNIYLNNADASILSHVIIRYGGSHGSLHLYQSDITIENCEISNSASQGIYCYASSPKILDNTITHNDMNGIYVQYSSPEIHGNHITNNEAYGIYFHDASECSQITHNVIINNLVPVRLPFSSLPDENAANVLSPNTINRIDFIGNTLTRNLVLQSSSNVYCQIDGNATIASGVKLTVSPGLIWKMGNNLRIDVNGAFYAKGTEANPIVFTSYKDDTFGGDSNDDGYSTGQPGDWHYINFSDSVIDFLTRLEHVIIQYAGYYNAGALQLNSANVSLIANDIRYISSYGVNILNASPIVQGNTIMNCDSHAIYCYGYYQDCKPQIIDNDLSNNKNGIFVNNAKPVIQNNRITNNNDWGIYFQQAIDAPVITKNTITDNKQSILIPASALPSTVDANILVPNQYNSIWIHGNERETDLHLACINDDPENEINTYMIYDTLTITQDHTLTIDPGVILKFYDNAGLTINGALKASGESDNPIIFTSHKDDRYGGDSNYDGFQSGPQNGDWRGIYLSNQANAEACKFNHVILCFGGRANNGSIYAYATGFHMQNSIIANSSTNGIRGYQSNFIIENSELFGNTQDAIHLESTGTCQISHSKIFANYGDGIDTASSVSMRISNCEIFGNLEYGILNNSIHTIDAQNTWWGALDGPGGNGGGAGNPISENVDYEPFLTNGTSFSYFNAGDNISSGTITGPTVVKGIASKEWGIDAVKSTLYDLDQVILSYPSIDSASRFEIFITYYNADNTDSIGGNIQRLLDAHDREIHRKLYVSGNLSGLNHFYLPSESHTSGNLLLKFVKDNGYRAVISQLWIVERSNTTDTQSPVSVINLPESGQHLSSDTVEINGQSTDDLGTIHYVEVGVAQGEDIVWYPVTQLKSDGRWIYQWQMSGDGPTILYARARDQAGNLEIPETGISVVVNTTAPSAVSQMSGFDAPEDQGGTIVLLWHLSSDDGTGANDVAEYHVLRTGNLNESFTHIQTVSAGINYYTDSGIENEQEYYYRIQTQDKAGNISLSDIYGPVIAIDNQSPDNLPPEDISDLNAIAGNQFVYASWTKSLDSAHDLLDQILDISLDDGLTWQNPIHLGKEMNDYLIENLMNETSYQIRIRTKDSSGNISDGVISESVIPSTTAVNTVSGTIHTDTTWAAGIYYVNNNLTVYTDICLTIKPGVVIKMAPNKNFVIRGTLHAVGTSDKPIVFTAYSDDRFGGDSNGDGDSTGTKGAWGKLNFSNATSSLLEHVKINYAGFDGSINVYQSDLIMKSCEIKNGASHGIYVYSASPQIINNTISNNDGSGILLQYATPVIDGNIITENASYGVLFNNATDSPELTRNVITNNDISIRVPFSSLPGKDAGNTLYPNTKNHIEFIGNTLNRSLELESSPINTYYQVSGNVTIATGVMLRLSPGTIWKFANNTGLDIKGAFYVVGNNSNKIVFTSWQDDEFGGDTDGNGFSRGKAGDWQQISFADSVIDFLTRLEHVIIRYAGQRNNGAVYLENASVDMAFAEISHSSSYGLYLLNASSPLIHHSSIVNCQNHGIYSYAYYASGAPQLIENTISNNLNGIYISGTTPVIEKNTIKDNQNWGIYFGQTVDTPVIKENTITGNKQSALLPASMVPGSDDGNIFSPNTINGLWVLGNERTTDLHLKLLFAGQDHEMNTYQIHDTLTINENATLTIDPGVIVKFNIGASFFIKGKMAASGTAEHPIIFTSYKDDYYGGDFNRDSYNSIPFNGDWRNIYFYSTPEASIINHAVIRFGGNANSGCIYVYNSDLVIKNTVISNSSTNGIRGYRANLDIFNTDVFGNALDGIYVESTGNQTILDSRLFANFGDGMETNGSVTASLTGCEIFGNQEYGIRNSSNLPISARDNWWGAPNGPSFSEAGSGDEITDQVIIDPYRMDGTEYFCFDAGGSNHYGYGIVQPVFTGNASTEWGDSYQNSILFRLDNQAITAEYIGLASEASYHMLVTYLNKDTQNSIQFVSDIHDHMIQQAMKLPENFPVQYDYSVPTSSIENGNLKLFFNRTSGLRTVLSGLVLMKHRESDTVKPEIHITSPHNDDILSGKQIVISGIAKDPDSGIQKVSVGIQQAEGTTQWYGMSAIGSTGIWQYCWDLPDSGNYRIFARATDKAGNLGTAPESVQIQVDTNAPSVPENILAQNLSGPYGIIIHWDKVLDTDVVRYDIYRSENRFDNALIAQIDSGEHQFTDNTVSNGMAYYYYVTAVDHAGNMTNSEITGPIVSSIVPDITAPEDVTDLKATVTQIPGLQPAFFINWSPSLDTEGDLSGQLLYVSKNGIQFGSNPPDFNNSIPYALDRHASSYHISNLENDMTYYFKMTTYDEVPNESNGISISRRTMNAQNSYITLSGTLSNNTSIGSGLYYISSHLTIPSDVELRIKAGAIIKLARNIRIIVKGRLIAHGTESHPIIFTAFTDDAHGGDTNNDGESTGTKGYWDKIHFANSAPSHLEYVQVFYGTNNIYIDQSDVTVMNGESSNASSIGIYTYNSSSQITNNVISNNTSAGIQHYGDSVPFDTHNLISDCNTGIYIQYATPMISGNTITDNSSYGIYFNHDTNTQTITRNTIVNNLVSLRIPVSAFPDDSNILCPNTKKHIELLGNSLRNDIVFKIWDKGTPNEMNTYIVYNQIVVPIYTFLHIEPGVIIKFENNAQILVDGALIANASSSSKIVLTSIKDDRYGGDSNEDAWQSIPVNGDWRGLSFRDSYFENESHLNHVIMRYSQLLDIYMADIKIENSELSNQSTHAIQINNASPAIIGNKIWGNTQDGIYISGYSYPQISFNSISSNLSDGVEIRNSSDPILSKNRIFMNRNYGVNNQTSNIVDATHCWWGDTDASGPYQEIGNPEGTGNPVSQHVNYEYFQTTVATSFSHTNFKDDQPLYYGSISAPELIQGALSNEWDSSQQRPDRTMAWDKNQVIVNYTGLEISKPYHLRVSYYNGDPGFSFQSLTNGNDNIIHESMVMPSNPVQFEFSIPSSFYASGDLQLKFVHDNPDTSIRAAVPEIFLMESIIELTPPHLEKIEYNDRDGSQSLTLGDEYYFHFSEEMDISLVHNNTTDANEHLKIDGNLKYGTINTSRWTADKKTVVVRLTEGFSITGNELITPEQLTDLFGNAAIGSKNLNTTDSIAPIFTALNWQDMDNNKTLSEGDRYIFQFNETMDKSVIRDNTQDANIHLRPHGGMTYGQTNHVIWSSNAQTLTLTVTQDFTILGDENVILGNFVCDIAGNTVQGTHYLTGKDLIAPEILNVLFDDIDGSGTVSLGDYYIFKFSESMNQSALSDNSSEANENLSPSGKIYGEVNKIEWQNNFTLCNVLITKGFNINGNETVNPSKILTDKAGNAISNTVSLTVNDTVNPQMIQIQGNYISPVGAVDNYRLSIRFNTSMNPEIKPSIRMISSGENQPQTDKTGTWLTSLYPNDTYVTPNIQLISTMDGKIDVTQIADCEDMAGNMMLPLTNVYSFTLDATPPQLPIPAIQSLSCEGATIVWQDYVPPDDLAGFQIFLKKDAPFHTIVDHSPLAWLEKNTRIYELSTIELNQHYFVAVVSVDKTGNRISDVHSLEIMIETTVPEPVHIEITAGKDGDAASISWTDYAGDSICGFGGYLLFYEETEFTSLNGLQPKEVFAKNIKQHTVKGLDRNKHYYFAVSACNVFDTCAQNLFTQHWSDPYAGQITDDIVLGSGDEKEISIYSSLIITNGAQMTIVPGTYLYFANGAGISVESGALIAQGTAIDPIVFTSENEKISDANSGDWEGIRIMDNAGNSKLAHVYIQYGKGLQLNNSSPAIDALSCLYNTQGILLENKSMITSAEAYIANNTTGIQMDDSSLMSIHQSIIRDNGSNAAVTGATTLNAIDTFWASTDPTIIESQLSGSVSYTPFLIDEPLLTPAIATLNRQTTVGSRSIELQFACRGAKEMRISEDSTFKSVFFQPFSKNHTFTLSENAGSKTIFVQFKSGTGKVSDKLSLNLTYITEGPVITHFNLSEGQIINRPVTVNASASAVFGMDMIDFYLDDSLIKSLKDQIFTYDWDVRVLADGIHRVKLLATDLAGNIVKEEINIILSISPPTQPEIIAPADNVLVHTDTINIKGIAEAEMKIQITRNGYMSGTVTASSDGSFALSDVTLVEGSNSLIASALDNTGISTSKPVNIILDTAAPAAPILLAPESHAGLGIALRFKYAESGERPIAFNIYRHDAFITDSGAATLLKDNCIDLAYVDTPPADGKYFYAIEGIDKADNLSPLSNVVEIDYDKTAPAFEISSGKIPPFGPGSVDIILTVSEKLFEKPSLTISPAGLAAPESVQLTKMDDFHYQGIYDITENTPSGIAIIAVSGKDLFGNMYIGKPSGPDFKIDSDGPVAAININTNPPVQITESIDIALALTFNEKIKPGIMPILTFNPPEGNALIISLSGSDTNWNGMLQLKPEMGKGNAIFEISAMDIHGNICKQISSGKSLEIYNTSLPEPPNPPENLTAISKSGGHIFLSWDISEKAKSYQIFQSPGDCSLSPTSMIAANITRTEHNALPETDGLYCYGIRAERRGAQSSLSNIEMASSDRMPPEVPNNVSIVMGKTGLILSWDSPAEQVASYYIYRNGMKIRSIEGNLTQLSDHPPTGGDYEYIVAAVDSVQNENPSQAVHFSMAVGAVSELVVEMSHEQLPHIYWENNDNHVLGYNVYRGGKKLNSEIIEQNAFVDPFYAGTSMLQYDIRAVNAQGNESPSRVVNIYPVLLGLAINPDINQNASPLISNVFNQYQLSIKNNDTMHDLPVYQIQLDMQSEGIPIFTWKNTMDLSVSENSAYSEIIIQPSGSGMHHRSLTLQAIQMDQSGNQVIYTRKFELSDIERSGQALEISTKALPLSGGYANIMLCMVNHGFADMDVVVSKNNGADPGDIYVAIKNDAGVVISKTRFNGFPSGTRVTNDGTAYVRIAPHSKKCIETTILVPEALEKGAILTFEGVIEQTYYRIENQPAVKSGLISGQFQSGITRSEYFGTASTQKDVYTNNEPIFIKGQAIDRQTNAPKADVDLKVGFYSRGFKWFENVQADESGNYTYVYQAPMGLSGNFMIWAAHPDVFDTIDQDQFDLFRLYCTPSSGDIRMSKADTMNFVVELYNPGESTLTDFTFDFRSYTFDNEGNEVEEERLDGNILYDDFILGPGEKRSVNLILHAAIDAPDNAGVAYTFISSQGASVVFQGTVSLLPAEPIISVINPSVGYVDVSIDRGEMKTISVTLKNNGLEDLRDVEMILPQKISWMTSNLPENDSGKISIADLHVGDTFSFDVIFMPPDTDNTSFGYHEDKIVIKGSNAEQTFDVRLYAMITSNLNGSALFKVSNILGQDVENARIFLRNTAIQKDLEPVRTNDKGEAHIPALQEGKWSWKVVASGHSSKAGVVDIGADQEQLVEVMLSRSLVTINFTVEPVPFTDRYEVKIEQTFETHVPAGVLVLDPPKKDFVNVTPDFHADFIVKVKNFGLIKIHDLTISTAQTPWGLLEPLISYVPELGAMEEMEVPYRLIYYGDDQSRKRFDTGNYADCVTGGFAELAQGLLGLNSAFNGRTFCYGGAGLGVANGLIVGITLYNAIGMITSPVSFIGNAISCFAQQFVQAGPGGGAIGPSTRPSQRLTGEFPCFTPETLIMMADGSQKEIKDIQVGDMVLAYNGNTDQVKKVHTKESDHIREIWYSDGKGLTKRIQSTDDHLFWVNNLDWMPARKIKTDDVLMSSDGSQWKVIRNEQFSGKYQVYNFDVRHYRSYFANGVLVHERCGVRDAIVVVP